MTIRQPGDNGYIARDIAIGAGIEGYRAYQATGDLQVAAKAAVSGGATILGGFLVGCVAAFCWISAGCGFLVGEPGIGFLFLLGAVVTTGIVVSLIKAHSRRMNRYVAPQPIPAPPMPTPGTALVQQYTYNVQTGQFHKNW